LNVDRPGAAGWTGADMNILFQDTRFVVLDKPAGLKVHAGPGGGPSVEDFFPMLSRRRDGPWLAHRLDADTSGCLVIALRRAALHAAPKKPIGPSSPAILRPTPARSARRCCGKPAKRAGG
jgi:tRNA pseudouridine32 synthase/23S rRNA pseudouridine746 synthase